MNKTISIAILFLILIPTHVTFAQLSTAPNDVAHAARDANSSESSLAIETATLGQAKNVHRLGHLFFAGQFTEQDLTRIKEEGIERIITLRTDGELDWDEKAAVETEGIEFIAIPFRSPESLTDEVFNQVREALAENDKPTLFHCGSANRVGGTWLAYRVLDEGVELDIALAEAREIGLRAPFIEKKALDYIKRAPTLQPSSGS
ncbi:MAG: beta-lactamase hydrolase domain-containing protein [Pirellulaceae bacterium]